MNGYPVLLQIEGWPCVVVGGGEVATRKIRALLEAGGQVSVISPRVTQAIEDWRQAGQVKVYLQSYISPLFQILKPKMAFAATNQVSVNQQVAIDAEAIGAYLNRADTEGTSQFTPLAAFRRGPITVGVATEGASPALAVHLRRLLESAVGPEYGILAEWLAQARPHIQTTIPDEAKRRHLWQSIIASPIVELLAQGQTQAARQLFDQYLMQAQS